MKKNIKKFSAFIILTPFYGPLPQQLIYYPLSVTTTIFPRAIRPWALKTGS